ncbi:MAG: LysM peptidoglycan-binding domain-containing protein [Chitinophagaceae bacterium]|nr:MAG: LysM peptidoglycan-binding domain-containing protein [Chitinophagaceae bacterium]
MKKIALLFLSFCLGLAAICQELKVQSNEKGMFVTHTVAPKENFYSVGRMFSIPPKEIAAFNNLDMTHGLTIGQTVQIPLTPTNFSQASNAQGRPVYYVVGEKEGLYRVSLKNGKVLMADLRKWNNLKSDAITTGQKLIVGYLSATQTISNAGGGAAPVTPVVTTPPVATPPAHTNTPDSTSVKPPVTTERPPADSAGARPVQVVPTPAPASQPPRTATKDGQGGAFRAQYEQQAKAGTTRDASVISGIFKTASGWQDMKYYLLVDGAEPGTLVKVTNPANNKVIYAKVLGGMSGIRQNQGFDIRISNAAASVLEIGDTEKFTVRIQY